MLLEPAPIRLRGPGVLSPAMALLERNGVRVAYEVAGPDGPQAARDAPVVVLLHNIFCDRRVFAEVTPALRPHARVIALDLRGHGESPLPATGYDIADLVADVVAVLDREGAPRATVVGVSIGATVAMELALAHPARVERLVLMGADGDADRGLVALRNGLFRALVRLMGLRGFLLDSVLKTLLGSTFRRDGGPRFAAQAARIAAFSPRAAAAAMAAWSGRRPLLAAVATVSVPSLVVVGDEDVSCPLPCGEAVATALPAARLVHLPAAGHTMTAEQPEAAGQILLKFLAETPA